MLPPSTFIATFVIFQILTLPFYVFFFKLLPDSPFNFVSNTTIEAVAATTQTSLVQNQIFLFTLNIFHFCSVVCLVFFVCCYILALYYPSLKVLFVNIVPGIWEYIYQVEYTKGAHPRV